MKERSFILTFSQGWYYGNENCNIMYNTKSLLRVQSCLGQEISYDVHILTDRLVGNNSIKCES